MAEQLSFELPAVEALGREDFFVSQANAAALTMLENTETWDKGKCLLVGPEASGKTHLAHVWANLVDARITSAEGLDTATLPELISTPLAVEDIHTIASNREAEDRLFHLFNLAKENHQPLLMTARELPGHLSIALPDLKSRLQSIPVAELQLPDDDLLATILLKHFADRQLVVPPSLFQFLLPRMDRSFAGVRSLVKALDKEALAQRKPINRMIAQLVLDKIGSDSA